MSEHVCRYVDGECGPCADAAIALAAREVFAVRGRWMVVDEYFGVIRTSSLSRARRLVATFGAVGIRAHVRRFRTERVFRNHLMPCLEVSGDRWLP